MAACQEGYGFIFEIEYRNIRSYIARDLRFLTKGMNDEYGLEQQRSGR
jgi:hypothetical protein